MSEASTTTKKKDSSGILLPTAFMLFSMFFGAGNLIFPPMLGAMSGENFPLAILGFLIGGVLLPSVTIIAVAVSGSDVSDLSKRAGRLFGWLFPILVYLSIGPFYGLPRMGSVAYSTAFVPIFSIDSQAATIIFNAIFFTIAVAMAWNSSRILDSVGRILTPLLLLFLAILILRTLQVLEPTPHEGTQEFVTAPVVSGLLQGYLTMDSIAALAFGIIVIRTLRKSGNVPENRIIGQTSLAALIAAALLTIVYIGLGTIGRYIPHPQAYDNGAKLLTDSATLTMGDFGRIIFGLAVLAACLTTAIGLLAACSGFFHRLIPAVSYHAWLLGFAVITFFFAIMGLDVLLSIAGPLIGFLYPIGITLVVLTLISPAFARISTLPLTFRAATVTATIWSALTTLTSLDAFTQTQGWMKNGHSLITSALSYSPWQDLQLGWLAPVGLVMICSLLIDVVRGNRSLAR